jgi:putative transposase
MDDYEGLSHSKWECKYHVVFIPKCRRKTLYGELRHHLGEVFRRLAMQKSSRVEEGHLMPDHVHMMISIPPKYAVSQVIGYIKGKRAIHLARVYGERKRNFIGQHFWARGSGDKGIHQEARGRGRSPGAVKHVALGPLQVATAAQHLKPPALPGDSYLERTRS